MTTETRDPDKQPKPAQKPADLHDSSDLNDPKKAPGTGISPAEDQPEDASAAARDLAAETIDELSDDRTSDAEVERRKRELIDGPAELRKARRDIP